MTGQATREHAMSEGDFQRRVMDTATAHHWHVCHIRAAQHHGKRWGVPYEGDSGLPDLILARAGVVLLAELKSASGKPTPEQSAWLDAAGGHGRLWRPTDWPAVLAELSATPRPEAEETLRSDVIDMGYLSLPADVQREIESTPRPEEQR